jgi:formamidopyrimidine-DNA glycosylase
MPELPVETSRTGPGGWQTILTATMGAHTATPSPSQFKQIATGDHGYFRRAKYLVVHLKAYNFLIHLRMSGDLVIRAGKIKPENMTGFCYIFQTIIIWLSTIHVNLGACG